MKIKQNDDLHSEQASLETLKSYIKRARLMVKHLWRFETEDWIRGLCVADIDQNGNLEVAVAAQDQILRVVDAATGQLVWKAHVEQSLFNVFVTDVDRDGEMEVIAGAGTSPQNIELEATDAHLGDELRSGTVYVFSEAGYRKWQFEQSDKIRGLAAADINHDNAIEIVMGLENNQVLAVNRDGRPLWSGMTGEWVYVIHLADLEDDGYLEVLAGSGDGHAYAYKSDGQLLWKFRTGERVYSIETGDIDGDGEVEIIVGSGDRNIYILGPDGVHKATFLANERVRCFFIQKSPESTGCRLGQL